MMLNAFSTRNFALAVSFYTSNAFSTYVPARLPVANFTDKNHAVRWPSKVPYATVKEAQKKKAAALAFYGSHYAVVVSLQQEALHAFRTEQIQVQQEQRKRFKSSGFDKGKTPFGYDGPGWRSMWIRRRGPRPKSD